MTPSYHYGLVAGFLIIFYVHEGFRQKEAYWQFGLAGGQACLLLLAHCLDAFWARAVASLGLVGLYLAQMSVGDGQFGVELGLLVLITMHYSLALQLGWTWPCSDSPARACYSSSASNCAWPCRPSCS
jgi:hypothetical protein